MASSGETNAPRRWDSGDIAIVRSEALDVLSDASLWQLAGARWQAIDEILTTMDAALARGDMDAFAVATANLELAGPLRIVPIGSATGPAKPTRDLLNKLVHSLGGVGIEGPAGESGDAGAGNADTARR
jgi:hypothetical protein